MEIKYLNEEGEKISKICDLEFGKDTASALDNSTLLMANDVLFTKGYNKFSVEKNDTVSNLTQTLTNQIAKRLSLYQDVPSDFKLVQYHNILTRPENHFRVSTWALEYEVLGMPFFDIKSQAEGFLKQSLDIKKINHNGVDGKYVGFRILRPLKSDHNPFHRDSWIPYWRDTINIWLPICGFENGNTMQMIPGSHLWADSQILKTKAGVEISGKKYHVPAAIGTVNDFSTDQPNLKIGEGLIFSPFLIHGNGMNRMPDSTRVSLEFRFCKK